MGHMSWRCIHIFVLIIRHMPHLIYCIGNNAQRTDTLALLFLDPCPFQCKKWLGDDFTLIHLTPPCYPLLKDGFNLEYVVNSIEPLDISKIRDQSQYITTMIMQKKPHPQLFDNDECSDSTHLQISAKGQMLKYSCSPS